MNSVAATSRLARIAAHLHASPAVEDKVTIAAAYAPAVATLPDDVRVGDDCAALPDGDGYLLFAAEGMLDSFVAADPWFAGYSAVMVNISDVCAMGGRPLAVVDVLWSPEGEEACRIWDGMLAASRAYGVPIVGGHTTRTRPSSGSRLAVSIIGRAQSLLTSFDARPGDDLIFAVDLAGSYRGDKPFWNASVGATPERLREGIELLPRIAEKGWCVAAKDVSNGGVVGTLVMLLECSGVGAVLDLEALSPPPGVALEKWLTSFPSYGYLLSVPPRHSAAVNAFFEEKRIGSRVIGQVTEEIVLRFRWGGEFRDFWRGERDA